MLLNHQMQKCKKLGWSLEFLEVPQQHIFGAVSNVILLFSVTVWRNYRHNTAVRFFPRDTQRIVNAVIVNESTLFSLTTIFVIVNDRNATPKQPMVAAVNNDIIHHEVSLAAGGSADRGQPRASPPIQRSPRRALLVAQLPSSLTGRTRIYDIVAYTKHHTVSAVLLDCSFYATPTYLNINWGRWKYGSAQVTLNVGLFSNFKVDESKSQGDITYQHRKSLYAVASLGGGAPRVTPEGKNNFCGWIYKEQWTNEVGQVEKVRVDTL